MLQPSIKNYINSKCAEWIMKGGVDTEWDEFQNTLKKMKLDEYLATQQGAYDRMYNVQ